MSEILRVEGLHAGYGKVPVLRDVSFHVNEGEVVAIIGPNGAGKTTLLKTISGLIRPTAGKILFEGQEIDGQPPHRITRIGLAHVPEGGRLFPNMSVRENLLMGAYSRREALRTGVLEEVYEMFPVLRERSRQMARTLSGGEKQMLAIGRGLASRPRFLMLDEPSLGLAPKLVDAIYGRLQMLRERGLTVLLVEQNIHYALELADRGYVLENGRIVLEGTGEELARSEHIKKHYLGL
ncbi:MAG TPA: ABC transporter ATP-binding protein [Chloroflexi bacterium]|nr:ABC transporter ATP-binding protein [Chloroflexota bacterium]